MKKVIRFSKFFVPAVIISTTIIVIGIVGYFTQGFNLGVDFQAGINETVQLAYPVGDISFNGKGNAELKISETQLMVIFSGAEAQKQQTLTFDFKAYPTFGDLKSALEKQAGVTVNLAQGSESLPTTLMVPTFQGNSMLSAAPIKLYRVPQNESEMFATIEVVRGALKSLGEITVQTIDPISSQRFLIRVRDDGKDPQFTVNMPQKIKSLLETATGADRVVVISANYVGPRYSQTLAKQAGWLTFFTLLLILLYSTIRFRIEYAIGAVLSVVHDALIMVAFIVWTRMEFNTTTIAAILTILGYSINDTIVQFDRVREELKLHPADRFVDVVDTALTLTLGRTLITTLTTIFAVLALLFFTTGSIKDFALALLIGMTSGVYSTIYIAGAFIVWWDTMRKKRGMKETGKLAEVKNQGADKALPASPAIKH